MPAVSTAVRANMPLISPDGIQPFKASQLDAALKSLLTKALGAHAASLYSWHSARIYLACALLASGASNAQIQALCRWQTEDSLRIYARLNADKYHALLKAAASANVLSVSVASLPPLSNEVLLKELFGLTLRDVEAFQQDTGA